MRDTPRKEAIFGRPTAIPATRSRRALLLLVVAASTLFAGDMMLHILSANGTSALEVGIVILFTITFAWVAMAFWTAVAGFLLQLLGLDPLSLGRARRRAPPQAPLIARTAVVMPIYNEQPERVVAGLESTVGDLEHTGEGEAFDFYVLSDSTDPKVAAAEETAVAALQQRLGDRRPIYYRRRPRNDGRKAGNIAEFCCRWGANYDYMIVLDADSLMAGTTMTELARSMQANPDAGIIQTVPIPVRQHTFFGRFQQFAATLYSPMLAAGLSFWQTETANYWGHNAILCVDAFMDHCGLPTLPGEPPLGGEILSHDFVEAALMRRGGWRVFLFPEIGGSYEEIPTNPLDFAKRDHRWAEGNLQHLRLLGARGLHPVSRVNFLMGALAYGCSLFWLVMLALGTIDAVTSALTTQMYFRPEGQLFPDWPVARTAQMLSLLAIVVAMLILPKFMGLTLCLLDRERRRAFGGTVRVTISAVLELLFSVLIAPVMMTFHSFFVASILCGRRVKWTPQCRDGRRIPWGEATRATAATSIAGLFWGLLTGWVTPLFFWAMTPVLAGLVLAAPLVTISSSPALGQALQRAGLFLTPAETEPEAVLDLPEAPEETAITTHELAALPPPRFRPMPAQRLDAEWHGEGIRRRA
ncbi:MAG: glucans biosynthesis glucosyltransferase MdoH [Halofilum sp. (in: g-proteobacteria)]